MMDVDMVINYLKKSNLFMENSIIDGFVNDTNVKYLPLYFFEYFGLNKAAQEKVIKLTEKQIIVLAKIIRYSEIKNVDWVPLCACFSHFIENNNYANLVSSLEQTELTDDLIDVFLFSIMNNGNFFEVNSLDDLKNLKNMREKILNKMIKTNDPNIILLSKYGISYDMAFNIYKRYGKDVIHWPSSKEKDFLMDIKGIIEGKGTEKVLFNDYDFIINIDSILRNFFSKIYNNNFYQCEDDKLIGNIEGIPLYDAGVDFLMCIYSYGLASQLSIPDNFKEDWDRPSVSVDYMCNSIINSLNMKTHIKHCVFGFNRIGDNELALLGANDLGTGGIYCDVNVTNPYHEDKLIASVEFRIPDELLNNTRFTNNEVYRNRRRIIDGRLIKINPDYIVYFKTGVDNDAIKAESLKAAKDFGIPIVIVDCEKCLLANIDKIEKELNIFEERYDDSITIKRIIEMIYTLSSGYRDIAPNLLEKHLAKDKLLDYVNRICIHIDEISRISPKTALECINVFIDVLDEEFEKVLKSPYWVNKAREQGHVVERPLDIIEFLENKKKELMDVDYSLKTEYKM